MLSSTCARAHPQKYVIRLLSRAKVISWTRLNVTLHVHWLSCVKILLILSSHLRYHLPNNFPPADFPTKTLHAFRYSPMRPTCPTPLSSVPKNWTGINCLKASNIWWQVPTIQLFFAGFPSASCHFIYVHLFSSARSFHTPSAYALPSLWQNKFHTNTKHRAILSFVYSDFR